MKTRERVMWLLIGAAVGAGIALLYAPKTGKETRKYLRRKAEDAKEAITDAGEQVAEAGKAVYKKGAEIASSAASGAAGIFDIGKRIAKG